MKKRARSKNIYERPITYENVFAIWNIVRRTCKNRREVFEFSLNLHSNLMNIYNSLKNRTYTPSAYRTFMIFEPKTRLVMSQTVFDKIVNHFVANFYLLPYLEDSLMDSNIATRKKKGSSYAMKLIRKYVNEITMKEHPNEIYCLKIDVSKYFYTIDHNILIDKLKNKIYDKDVISIIKKIMDETNRNYINNNICYYNNLYDSDIPFYFNNKGLSIGAMTSQFLAIFYLDDLDHLIVEKLGCKYLCHYMDDIVILDTDKEKLKRVWKIIEYEIEKLKLKVNKKSNLYRLTKGVDFLGFRYSYSNSKLHISYKSKTYYKIKRKLRYLEKNDLFKYKKTKASYYGYFKIGSKNYEREDYSMKNIEIYNAYKDKYPNTLVIVKEGIFYSSYNEDANILWHRFGYKHLDNKVSFGQIPYDRVINELKGNEISFCIVDKEREYFKFTGDDNLYNNYLVIANKAYERQKKEDFLVNKVKDVFKNNPSKYDDMVSFLDRINENN